jgi:hypothetical protein
LETRDAADFKAFLAQEKNIAPNMVADPNSPELTAQKLREMMDPNNENPGSISVKSVER